MTNSNKYIQNKHDSCDGMVKTLIDGSTTPKCVVANAIIAELPDGTKDVWSN